MASSVRRILVLGASNAGKTSLINELTGQNKPVDNSASGCTQQTAKFDLYQHNEIDYEFIDSAGLFQAVRGDSISDKQMYDHLNSLLGYARSGLNLIVFVTRKGTIHQSTQDIYNLIVNIMCEKKTPTICVVTGCENEVNMADWVHRNSEHFSRNQMQFQKIIATCFAKGGPMELAFGQLRQQSAKDVWQAIEEHALHCCQPWTTDKKENDREKIENFVRQKKYDEQEPHSAQSSSHLINKRSCWPSLDLINTYLIYPTKNISNSVKQCLQDSLDSDGILFIQLAFSSLSEWLQAPNLRKKLLFKCSTTGFDSKEFHRCCDNRRPTVTLIRYDNRFLFGGFTNIPWSSTEQVHWDQTAFLFALVNPYNKGPIKYPINNCSSAIAVHHHPSYGPAFGKLGKDLCIRDKNSGMETIEIGFPDSYLDTTGKRYQNFAGTERFSTTDIEIYSLWFT
jgi:GTPase Era involved in 16S rRNA processing